MLQRNYKICLHTTEYSDTIFIYEITLNILLLYNDRNTRIISNSVLSLNLKVLYQCLMLSKIQNEQSTHLQHLIEAAYSFIGHAKL